MNQCDGCRRGLVLDNGIHRDGAGRGVMFCTAPLYETSGAERRDEAPATAERNADHSNATGTTEGNLKQFGGRSDEQ